MAKEIDDRRYGDEVVRLKADGRFELTPHGLRMVKAVQMATAATKKALPQPPRQKINRRLPQQEINPRFDNAMREEIIRLETLVQKTLQANPYHVDADEEEETVWRKVAHAARQLRPLLEALTKADDPHSEFATYGPGFRFRLFEAEATIARGVDFDRLFRLRNRRSGRRNRPKAVSPFTQYIKNYLKRNPGARAREVKAALIEDARESRAAVRSRPGRPREAHPHQKVRG